MRKKAPASSRSGGIVCPFCGKGEIGIGKPGSRCPSCDRAVGDVLRTLREIVALPDAPGRHACERGHPQMRLLPDGVYRCPACGVEVLPSAGRPASSGRRTSPARQPGVQ